MESSDEPRLDSAIRRGLKGIEGLPESARFADESITRYLKEKFEELLRSEYRRRSYRNEDEDAIAERTTQIMDGVVLDAEKLYRLFELHMNSRHDEFWEGLKPPAGTGAASSPANDMGKARFSRIYPAGAPLIAGHRRFYCLEGCSIEGEQSYLEHRDRGHHPVPE